MPFALPTSEKYSRLLTLMATILVIGVLYAARPVLVPIALAVLLCFILAPFVNRLQRAGLGRVLAVMVVTVLAFVAIGGVLYVVTVEALALADDLPRYRNNIREKARSLSSPGAISRATEKVREVTEEALKATTQAAETQPEGLEPSPLAGALVSDQGAVVVEVREPLPGPLTTLQSTIGPFIEPLGQAGLVVVFVIFMLIQREDLRDRVIRLIGPSQINLTTQVIDDAARRVSRFLLMQFFVNLTYGVPVAIGLMLLGVPNAVLWGVLCFLFRYIPYLGPWIGASMPIIISLAVFDGWERPLMVIGLFVVLELISNNAVEPWLYGSGTGISPIAVLLSAVFWTWLWGLPGLVLATPLTVCIVVLGRYLPHMHWLAVLLGDEPPLPPPAKVYQRLLAMDPEETFEYATEQLKTRSLANLYDEVLVPALNMSEQDRHAGTLDSVREQAVLDGMRALVDELGERADEESVEASKDGNAEAATLPRSIDPAQPPAIIVAARDEADELAAIMLAQLLNQEGRRSEVWSSGSLANEIADRAAEVKPDVICVSAMPPMAVSHARYVCKRVRDRLPDTPVVVGIWNASDPEQAARRLGGVRVEAIVTTFSQAIEKLRR